MVGVSRSETSELALVRNSSNDNFLPSDGNSNVGQVHGTGALGLRNRCPRVLYSMAINFGK
jgi:hypothetical protein